MSTVLVVGDACIDKCIEVTTGRLSPEAPIPVGNVQSVTYSLGGAANVAACIAGMGMKSRLVIPFDKLSAETSGLITLCEDMGVGLEIVEVKDRAVPIKSRIKSNHFYLARFDEESAWQLTSTHGEKYVRRINELLAETKTVVISDYNKGALTSYVTKTIIEMCNSLSIPVIVDPKGSDYSKYSGATLLKPNRTEADACWGRSIASETDWDRYEEDVIRRLNLGSILTTLGSQGMRYAYADSDGIKRISASSEEVSAGDVCGCGDTVCAGVAVLHAMGRTINKGRLDSLQHIGLLAVRQRGCFVPSEAQWEDALRIGKVVFTNGCFDILHAGHIELLRKSKALGGKLVIGVNDDSSVTRLKGQDRPINPIGDRIAALEALGLADEIRTFSEDTPIDLIKDLRPDVIVKGGDYSKEGVCGHDIVPEVIIIPLREGISTSIIQKRACSLPAPGANDIPPTVVDAFECRSPIDRDKLFSGHNELDNYERTSFGAYRQLFYFKRQVDYDQAYVNKYNGFGVEGQKLVALRLGALIGSMGKMPSSLLDVGYGNGDFLRLAVQSGIESYGTDISGTDPPPGAVFLPADKAFDHPVEVACFFDSLEHFTDISFIRKMAAEWVYVTLPYAHYPEEEWFRHWKHRRPDEHLWHFNEESLVEFFRRMGFKKVWVNVPFEDSIRRDDRYVPNILTGLFRRSVE